ncbi:VWA domain-containing protein [Vibrio splendidus]|uniref:vWA domain-containing protein n=1 Tax=Vibrio splendidus TaxID=29497 RepID=UPI0024692D4A|nr:VWA domain-containing protein [Vibrio splendidus]MDH5911484.1 VWA domain-containing protein [Vibrio splendidus]MDH5942731.1 VWA domain-containing protein [Vibrio splendidus]MDH5985722.1 VWA domain-containing protein [Vibrio splendidus]MDH5994308.1 VWA domain-containing protein [Vibrio splendidus]MDH6005149.1 VWA domain-containing protein [Vibrio splendidus]
MNNVLSYFHFMRPEYLWLLIPFIAVIYLNWSQANQQQKWLNRIPAHLLAVLKDGEGRWTRNLPLKVLVITCISIIVLLAGPTWSKQASPFGEDKSDLVVVLDVSDSMLEKDVAPSRLRLAQYKIDDLITQRQGGQTALIVYSGSAHVAMPLTRDVDVFSPLLSAINPQVLPRHGKFAQYTLSHIEDLLRGRPAASVLLVTDAVSQDAMSMFSEYFKQSPHQLLVLGVGDPRVESGLEFNDNQLETLANNTGGHYQQVTVDNSDIHSLIRNINQHLLMSEDNMMPWNDAGYYLIFVVALFYLLWFRKGWLVQWCWIGLAVSLSLSPNDVQAREWQFIDLWLTYDQQGQRLFDDAEFSQAASVFENDYMKALSYYHAGDYALAQEYFLRTDSLKSLFGAGAALAHQREYVAAKTVYQSILKEDPDYPGAQVNYDIINHIIEQIDQFSKSQSNNNERQNSRELGDKPKTSEGAETNVQQDQLIEETLTSEELLSDPQLNDKWMRRVDAKLERFLSSKFYFQLEDGDATQLLQFEQVRRDEEDE